MKTILLLIVLTIPISVFAQDQEYPDNQTSTTPAETRYELVQSLIAAKGTFKIDKFTGNVYQLVKTSTGTISWDLIIKEKVKGEVIKQGKVNYQFFTSGLAMKFTFLLNVNSGQTWQLVEDKKGLLSFQYFK
ncbi:MAG: hypothetical protein JRF35_15835 [Deltaproteobacteria bacterium]|nr:hypothetical protein [Deltaproteobacteria bacterium]